ncbi:hypothetical protein OG21DRAFT_1507773 [Imleria badia]|nr:hypothetical protein OG21DRAFT_1507773 [Imleria badia]
MQVRFGIGSNASASHGLYSCTGGMNIDQTNPFWTLSICIARPTRRTSNVTLNESKSQDKVFAVSVPISSLKCCVGGDAT